MQKSTYRNIYFDRSLKYKTDVPVTTFSFLFSEMIQYIMTKHNEDKELDLEEKLSSLGYPIGEKVLELCFIRDKGMKRKLKINDILIFIHNDVWKMLFNKQADGLQQSAEDEDEFRIVENAPLTNKYIFLQKNNTVNCASFFGGIIEGILNSADFRCKVSTFFYEVDKVTKTYYIIECDRDVIERDKKMK